MLKNYALGRLMVTGCNRYLSGDLLEFLRDFIAPPTFLMSKAQKDFRNQTIGIRFEADSFYAPGARFVVEEGCTVLRNPHIARNEELQLKPYTKVERLRNTYLSGLTDTVMISWDSLTAERLGGADFDGDMVKIITDELVNGCVRRNYSGAVRTANNIPLLKIPSFEPIMRDANDWEARFETVRSTFSSRIGQISNAALTRSLIAYNEKSSEEQRRKCREQTETLAILTGLEIDSVKTGVKPDLSEYLNEKELPKSKFLQYKALLEKAEKRREWYEPTYKEQFEKFFENHDWKSAESNLERLPYLAYMLGQKTKFKKVKCASDEKLFEFAQRPDWKEQLDTQMLEKVATLIKDYNAVLDRIRLCNQPIGNKRRQSDIRRILYRRGQDDDVDGLYAAFTGISADRMADIRAKLTEHQWLFTHPERREELLSLWLPELEDYYKLLCDFRAGGFRILSDLICDIDDENKQSGSRKYFRENDSEQFRALMSAYIEMPAFQTYRDAVTKKCRELLFTLVKPDIAVKCFAALGKRKEMLELLYDKLEKYIRRWRDA